MALNAIWLSVSGTSANSGTNSSVPKKSLADALNTLEASAGATNNVLYIINDGTHSMLNGTELVTTGQLGYNAGKFQGTSFSGTNFGIKIQGVTVNGTPALATVAATATAYHGLVHFYGDTTSTNGNKYVIIEGLRFDYTAKTASSTAMYVVQMTRTGAAPIRFVDCEIIGSSYGGTTIPAGGYRRFMEDYTVGPSFTDGIEFLYNVAINAPRALAGDEAISMPITCSRNVVVWDTDDSAGVSNTMLILPDVQAYETVSITHNTFYVKQLRSGQEIDTIININTTNATNQEINSNLFHVQVASDASTFVPFSGGLIRGGGSAGSAGSRGTMGYNYFALGTFVSTTTLWTTNAGGFYNSSWVHPEFGGVITNPSTSTYGTDVVATNAALSDTFNETTASWTWSDPSGNGYDHVLPFDMRPIVGRTAGLGSTVIGAIEAGISPVAVNDTYSITAGETLSVTAGVGVLSNDTPAIPGGTLTATLITDVTTGTLTFNTTTGAFTYQAPITYSGTQNFTYQALESGTPSNTANVSITVSAAPLPPGGIGSGISYDAVLDSLPFYRPVFKADVGVMVRVMRNDSFAHIDMRHYLKNDLFDESIHRVVEVAPSGRYVGTLGGVDECTAFMLETDTTVNVSVVWYNGTTSVTFAATVSAMAAFDQADIKSFVINNTSSATATVQIVAFQ